MLRRLIPSLGLALLLAALSYWLYSETIALPPAFIHAWTQSDRYALALGFLDNDFNLFLPQTYNLATRDGITAVDLPLHEYCIGLLMRLFGSESPMIFRVYTLVFCVLGYLGLARWGDKAGQWWAVGGFMAVFAFLLPVMGYFQAGFSPSATSLATALWGYGAALRFWQGGERRDYVWAVSGLTLAALCRMPFNIFLFGFCLQTLWGWWRGRKIWWYQAAALLAAYILVFGQHFYKMWVQSQYGSQFLTSLMPARSWGELQYILREVAQRWTFQYFSGAQYAILGLAALLVLIQLWRWRNLAAWQRSGYLHALIISAGACLYALLMARQYVDHEYYFIDSFYLPVLWWLYLGVAGINWGDWRRKLAFFVVGLPLLGWAALGTRAVQQTKYAKTLWDRGEVVRASFEGSKNWLDSIGVPADARILALDAYSTNAPLIAMRRQGYTTTRTRAQYTAEALQQNFDYIVCHDMFMVADVVASYPQIVSSLERVSGWRGLSLFRFVPSDRRQSLAEALRLGAGAAKYEFLAGQALPQGQEFFGFWRGKGGGRVLVEAYFAPPRENLSLKMVAAASRDGQTIYYWEMPLELRAEDSSRYKPFCFVFPDSLPADAETQCYLWNTSGQAIGLDSARVWGE